MQIDGKKQLFKKLIAISIFIIALLIVGIMMLKYEVEGEKNMPYKLTKISVVSNVTGTHNENSDEFWNLSLVQNNDIYLNFEKNLNSSNEALIKKVILDNIKVEKEPAIGLIKFYKTSNNISNTYQNSVEDLIQDRIEYIGSMQSNLEQQEIANNGGFAGIRATTENIGNHASNNTEIRIDGALLKGMNITNEELNAEISFDVILELTSGIKYKAKVKVEVPCGNIVEEGMCKKEINSTDDIIFKRF